MSAEVALGDVLLAFRRLVEATGRLTETLMGEQRPAWVCEDGAVIEGAAAREHACALYAAYFHAGSEDGRETRRAYGMLGASEAALERVRLVNDEKTRFAAAMRAYQRARGLRRALREAIATEIESSARGWLRWSGHSRLHLNHIYRHIHRFDAPPQQVGFSWYRGSSIKRVTAAEAEDALLRLARKGGGPHIDAQLATLGALRADTPLARVQRLRPAIRANLTWQEADGTTVSRTVRAALPFLVRCDRGSPLPRHPEQALPAEPPGSEARLVRSDRIIDPEPLLPSLRVHAYQRRA
ncbi:hypothetical protein J2T57_001250 [Natronocella acetinitrilica]|uniref:DNA replication terminus site-binding protein n=1 Tax=Natronocella acetinitrilica TaxID=414046 RepID=A0AAE3KBV6_9GAMM|nr:hypothetical protein [Natronocella acetinitrilica]MCP1674148.1 hypothetical protein [Natronocella acetinitrilica]